MASAPPDAETDNAAPAIAPRSGCAAAAMMVAAVVALLLYILSMTTGKPPGVGGDGLTDGIELLFAFLMWMVIAFMLALGGVKSGFRWWLAVALALLCIAATWAGLAGLAIAGSDPEKAWLTIVPGLLPWPIGVMAVILGGRAERRVRGSFATLCALAALPLIAIGIVQHLEWSAAEPARTAAFQAEQEAEARNRRAETEADFVRIRDRQPTARAIDLIQYANGEFADRAIAAIRTLPTRQADMERLLGSRSEHVYIRLFERMPEFDVRVTSALCEAYRGRPEWRDAGAMDQQVGTMRWLQSQGCDLRPQIEGARERNRSFARQSQTDFDEGPFNALLAMPVPAPANSAAPLPPPPAR